MLLLIDQLMSINIIHNDLFSGKEQAVILTVDGQSAGMEGNLARMFARRYPECWEEISEQINYPIPLGQARRYLLDSELTEYENCPYRCVIIASTLHHLEVLSKAYKTQIIHQALISALSLSTQSMISELATTIMSGGWRLPEQQALQAMTQAYQQFSQANKNLPNLNIYQQ